MKSIELAPGIVSFEGVMDNPQQFIYDLEGLVEIQNLTWGEATQNDGTEHGKSGNSKAIRDCKVISLPRYDDPNNGSPQAGAAFEVHKYLNETLNPVFELYCNMHTAPHWKTNEGWQILKYGKDNHFVNHYDDGKAFKRTISMSFYLNDNYEGGEIEFARFGLKIKPVANQAIFFPSNYVYNHTVHPVTSGLRYAVVGWWE